MNNLRNCVLAATVALLSAFEKKDATVLRFKFWVKASNENIEKFLTETARTEDDYGNRLSDEKIEENIRNDIENFHKSEGYSKDGTSRIAFNKIMTPWTVTFDAVKELLTGKAKGLPEDYKFETFDYEAIN